MDTIGVVGSGPVGRGLALLSARAGYDVVLGTRHPDAPKLAGLDPRIRIGDFAEAARAEVVFLSVVHSASRAVATQIRGLVGGKLVIDTDNAWIPADYQAAGLHPGLTEGTWMSRILPDSMVARAFSGIDWDVLVPSATKQPGYWASAYAIDDETAAARLESVIQALGYAPVRIGTLAGSASLDPGGRFWSRMLTPQTLRRELHARHTGRA